MRKIFIFFAATMFCLASNAQVRKSTAKPKPKIKVNRSKDSIVEISTDYGAIKIKLYNQTPLHRDNFLKLVREGFYDSLLFHRVIRGFMVQGGDPTSKHADSSAQLGSGDVGYKIPAEIVSYYFHKRGALSAARDNNPEKASSGCQFYIVQGKPFNLKDLEGILNNKNMGRKQELLYKLYQADTVQSFVSTLQNAGDKEGLRKYMEQLQVIVDKAYNKMPHYSFSTQQVRTYLESGGAPHLDGDYTVFGEVISGMEVVDKIADEPTRTADRPIKDIRMKIRILAK